MRPLGNATLARIGILVVACTAPLAGCTQKPDPVPSACFAEPAALLAALRQAPAAVALADGTRLSRCVSAARTDGDLQSLGLSLGGAADALRVRAGTEPGAALQLGYLAGAVQAGAQCASGGIADQLARRVGQLAALQDGGRPAAAAALRRGQRAGERGG